MDLISSCVILLKKWLCNHAKIITFFLFCYANSMKLMNSGELTFLSGGILKLAILFSVSKKFAVLLS